MGLKAVTRKTDGVTVWMIDFYDQHGRRVREVAGTTKKQAKDVLAKRIGEVRAGTYVNPREEAQREREAIGPTFAELVPRFLSEYIGKRRSPRSTFHRDVLRVIERTFGERRVRAVTRADVAAYLAVVGVDHRSSTVRRYGNVLRSVFNFAEDMGVIPEGANPTSRLKLPPEPPPKRRRLTVEEWNALHATAPDWLRPLLTFALLSGLRLQEVAVATWADFDRRAGVLRLNGENKTGSTRPVNLTPAAQAIIEAQVRHVRVPNIFTENGQPHAGRWRQQRITKETIKAAKRAGLDGVTFHALRRTFASWAADAGAPVTSIQSGMGHATSQQTDAYIFVRAGDTRAADAVAAVLSGTLAPGVDTPVDTRPESDATGATA